MALTKNDLIEAFNVVYAPDSSGPISWDGLGQGGSNATQKQIIALLINILVALDPSFSPPGGSGTNTAALTDYTAPTGTVTLPTATYIEVSIYALSGSAGTIEGTAVIPGTNYIYRASQGKALDELEFTVTSGTFQVLTITA